MPQFGATFVPGGYDDYYMPEVIAPSPQRVMPEVPQNMQEDLQRLEQRFSELDASEPRQQRNTDTSGYNFTSSANTITTGAGAAQQAGRHPEPSLSTIIQNGGASADTANRGGAGAISTSDGIPEIKGPPAAEFKPFKDEYKHTPDTVQLYHDNSMDTPLFSPFPKVKGDNIPPSDEEKEEILYNARDHVLHSNNVSMQLSWARDSLAWVEIASDAYQRENKARGGPERPATPKIEHDLKTDAVSIVSYLAEQGHPEALFMRSKWLEFGKFGNRSDKKEAYVGYRRAAEQGFSRAEYRMGMLYENANEMEKAIKHYIKGQEQGDSAASYRLGMMSLLGQHGYRKDFQRGLDLIQLAADTSDEDAPQGAYVYGMLIARELPDLSIPEGMLPANLGLARQYIEKAAYLGFAKAQSKMGQAYELCQLGCDFNPAYSLHYYGLAARQGQPEAALGVSRWFLFGYEGAFPKNETLAFKYAQQAADAKLATGEFAMGYYYEIGIHVNKDVREARNWYEKAAENGNKDAIQRLESLSQSKTLTKRDHETTALTRIKSQHGSQRGQRPERFRQKVETAMPTLSESVPGTPVDGPPLPALPAKAGSPRQAAIGNNDPSSRHSSYNSTRPPAFGLNVDQNLPVRSKSTAPYPEDDTPPPLNLSGRPKSTAPYPEDGQGGAYGGGYRGVSSGPPGRNGNTGPQADRPMSAFGIRPVSPSGRPYPQQRQPSPGAGGPGMRQSQSTGSGLIPPAGTQPNQRGRVVSAGPGAMPGWESQTPSGYRQSSPSRHPQQGMYDAGGAPQPQRIPPAGSTPPVGDPTRTRLTKQNPHGPGPTPLQPYTMSSQRPGSSGGNGYNSPTQSPPFSSPMQGQQQQQPGVAQPGRDYGPRSSSRPVSDMYGGGGPGPQQQQQQHPPRVSSAYAAPLMSGAGGSGPGGRPPIQGHQLKDRPAHLDAAAGRQSAPPVQQHPASGRPSPAPTTSGGSAASAPPARKPVGGSGGAAGGAATGASGKPAKGQGPATFEEMGIPQGKNDDDCCVM